MATQITQIPLQLEEYFLTAVNVEWRQPTTDGELKLSRLNLDTSYDLAMHAEIAHAYQMTLTVSGEEVFENPSPCGYKFNCVIVGRYRIENAPKPEMEPRLARVNGVSLLYSTLRGILGTITGSFAYEKLVLPSIDPKKIVERVEEQRAQTSGSTPPLEVSQAVLTVPDSDRK